MRPIDLSLLMQAFAADLVHDRAVLLGQVQFRLAHDNTSMPRSAMVGVYSCSVTCVSKY